VRVIGKENKMKIGDVPPPPPLNNNWLPRGPKPEKIPPSPNPYETGDIYTGTDNISIVKFFPESSSSPPTKD